MPRKQLQLSLIMFDTPAIADRPIDRRAEADWDAGIATRFADDIR